MNFIANETAQKLRGGYYTPPDLAVFLARWVAEIAPKRILEPSAGDGEFFRALGASGAASGSNLTAFEIDPKEARKARVCAEAQGFRSIDVHADDFLEWADGLFGERLATFDAVVGNPPFIRYQYLPKPFQARAEAIFCDLGLPFTKHTNAWVPFILASMAMLRPGGRLAMVVPAEIIHVAHAQSLRTYLGQECRRIIIVDPEDLWFPGTLQGAVLLLAEKRSGPNGAVDGLGIYPVKGRGFLRLPPSTVFAAPRTISGKAIQGKWTHAIMDAETRDLFNELAEHREVHRFMDVAKVDVGIVTGANKFFLVPDETVRQFGLSHWAHPAFGRSEHCPGIIYEQRQHAANAVKGSPTNLLWIRGERSTLDPSTRDYISLGEAEGLHTRFKCRVRSPWYTVPSVYSTEIGMLKRSHHAPRMILNRIGAYTTDTAYRIRAREVDAERLVACFINPLTALSAELEGRHYGGGVLELVPSEIERLLVPLPAKASCSVIDLDRDVRSRSAEMILTRQGKSVFGALGLSAKRQAMVLNGWKHLRNRRQRVSTDSAEADDS